MLTRVNISQNNVTVYREAVPTNQTQKSSFIQSKNKDHATKKLLHGCLRRALVKPCSNPYIYSLNIGRN